MHNRSIDKKCKGGNAQGGATLKSRGPARNKKRILYYRLLFVVVGLFAMYLSFFFQLIMSRHITNTPPPIAKLDDPSTRPRLGPKGNASNMDTGNANRTRQSHLEEKQGGQISLLGDSGKAGTTASKNPYLQLHDQTIHLSSDVQRPWLDDTSSSTSRAKTPAKVLLTNYGWNHPNQTIGLSNPRSARQRELLQGVVDHPWFDPSGWEDIMSGKADVDPDTRYYVFLDVETCFEANYPDYKSATFQANSDVVGGRSVAKKPSFKCYNLNFCPTIPEALKTPLFKAPNVTSTLVILDCKGDGPPKSFRRKAGKDGTTSISVASVSSAKKMLNLNVDQGMPPPAVKQVILSPEQEKDIETCNEDSRPYLLTFSGAGRGEKSRRAIIALNNDKDIFTTQRRHFKGHKTLSYDDLLTKAKFSAAPRGTNLFSYRFTEIMSAGAIPVVHADGWVWPFRKELIDWNECAVIMPESEANRTEEVLRGIDDEQRCRMRKRCYEIYKKYVETGNGIIAGIVDGLELTLPSLPDNGGSRGVVAN